MVDGQFVTETHFEELIQELGMIELSLVHSLHQVFLIVQYICVTRFLTQLSCQRSGQVEFEIVIENFLLTFIFSGIILSHRN